VRRFECEHVSPEAKQVAGVAVTKYAPYVYHPSFLSHWLTFYHQGCKITRTILDPPSTLHITQCDTVCSGCYFFYACRSSTRFPKTNGGICSHRSRLRRGPVARDLCYSCNTEHLKSGDVAARERKEMTELKHIESAKVFCSLCHVRLWRFTPRWWVCSICGVECRSRLHTHWV